MCGIFGHFSLRGGDRALVERMASRLAHRGPDGSAVHVEGSFAFGAVRLAIIDLSAPAGAIYSEDRRTAVVFNGEIYNHQSLRRELERHGHCFATHTDTEVIVHGYEQWGVDVIQRLRGMFALGIWDGARERMLLARDRLGEKPLYYARVDGDFLFASEIKALLEDPRLRPQVNDAALPQFLVLGYTAPPDTLFAGIHKLGPGEHLLLNAHSQRTETYWRPHMDAVSALPYQEAVQAVWTALGQAVSMQMMSDVPVGAFLSGGVDSTAVTAFMQRMSSRPINTFSVGFEMPPGSREDIKFNVDLHYAQMAAQALGTQHHAIRIRADEHLMQLIPHLVYALDEPSQVATFVQTIYVAAAARSRGVLVLLNGEAGDELFLGYNHYRADRVLERYLRLPSLLRAHILNPILGRLPGARFEAARNLVRKTRRSDEADRYLEWSRILGYERLPHLLSSAALAFRARAVVEPDLRAQLALAQARPFTDRIAYANLRRIVGENYNMRVDKMCMAMSVETRAPFQDYELVDLAFSLPLDYKLRRGDFKRVLKDAVRDLVPETILRRPKWGFSPPQSEWLRTCLRPLVETVLAPERVAAAGYFQPQTVSRLVHAHIVERKYEMWAVWSLLVFHLWHAVYIDHSVSLDHRLCLSDFVPAAA